MVKLHFVVLICYATLCYGIRSKFTYYTELNCTGDGLLLDSKQGNAVPEAPRIISTSKSYSATGFWMAYTNLNFVGAYHTTYAYDYLRCVNTVELQQRKSIRYIGPPDTTTHSVSFYEESGATYGGRELVITGPASAYIPFTPRKLFSTGSTSWTFYSGANFDGISTCYIPNTGEWFGYLQLNSTFSIRSVLRGCDRHIDLYISGDIEKNDSTLNFA